MSLEKIVREVKNATKAPKRAFDMYFEPAIAWLAGQAIYLKAADEALNKVSQIVDKNEGPAMLGTYVGLGGLWFLYNKVVKRVAKSIYNRHKKKMEKVPYKTRKQLKHPRNREFTGMNRRSFLKTLGILGGAVAAQPVLKLEKSLSNFRWDGQRVLDAFAREQDIMQHQIEDFKRLDITPPSMAFKMPADLNLVEVRGSNIFSKRGKFLRTYRWDQIISSIEKKHGIQQGLIAGLIMRESYGNPLQLNSRSDGGAGLMMFQPGTAKLYGLKTHGDSSVTGRDRNHGLKLKKLVREHNWDYMKLSGLDERFDVFKSIDAGARYIRDMEKKYGTWDKALSAYNRGTPTRSPKNTEHVKMTRLYQEFYLEQLKNRGHSIDKGLLEELEVGNGLYFEFIRVRDDRKYVYKHMVIRGENPTVISSNFNKWVKKKKFKFIESDYRNVKDANGNYIGSKIFPEKPVYIVATPKKK